MLVKEMIRNEQPSVKIEFEGAERLSNAELLTLITSALDTEHANNLLKVGFNELASMSTEQIQKLSGLTKKRAQQLRASIELSRRMAISTKVRKTRVDSPQAIAEYFMEEMRHNKKECFKVLLLNVQSEVIGVETVSIGNINSSIVDPREVFNLAVKKSAARIALVHQHPSGNPKASEADIKVTKRLIEAGEILDIKIIDHIIIGDGVFTSLKSQRLM